jgi:short-subunit dehydrogenase
VPLILEIDITDEAACKRAIDQVKDHFGRIDLLINNAGITHIEALNEHHGQIIKKVMDVNFFGSVNCTMAALSSLKASQGHIVTLSSVAGFAPLFGRTAYSASKYALHGFFETLRTELTTYDVNVTMVCPSFIDTGIRSSNPDSIHQEKTTVGESITPDQAAKILIKGIAQKKRLILIGRTAKLSYWVKKLMPRYYDKKMLEGLGKG